MSTPSNQWYVEMSAGITLGPMPFDAVVELAETSAIMRDDRIREESSKEWKSAHEMSGLFSGGPSVTSDSGAVSLAGFEVADTSPEKTKSEKATHHSAADVPAADVEATEGVVRLDGFEVLLGETATPSRNAVEPGFTLHNAAANLETAAFNPAPVEKAEPVSTKQPEPQAVSMPEPDVAVASDEIPELDVPAVPAINKPKRSVPESPPFDPGDTSPAVAENRPSEPDSRKVKPLLDLAALVNAGVEEGAPPERPPAAAMAPSVQTPIQPWRPPVKVSRQLMFRVGYAAMALVGVYCLTWLLTPNIETATYDQYAAMYLEYQILTESPDSGSWSEFATRAKAELDESLPDLEAAAVPGERRKSLLLYAGRDLRTALELTPGTVNPHAERLAGFFEQLNELHASDK